MSLSTIAALSLVSATMGFVPTPHIASRTASTVATNLVIDPSTVIDTTATVLNTGTEMLSSVAASESSSSLLSFADQGQNLAGIFFQASLLPYLTFLYFLSFRGNRIPALGNFGWQFLLLFVLSTIPGGIITKSVYGSSLADCDWLHGSAEALLTVTNILIVLGFKSAMTQEEPISADKPRLLAIGAFILWVAAAAAGPQLGFEGHSAFLFGAGDLPADTVLNLPWVSHTEPVNALSIPTWAIHFSSVFEFLFAMSLIWDFAETTGNEKWKGLTWGMLPLHASGIAACTYHFFYNPSSLQFLVSTQAGLTLLGNITVAIAAYRIAVSNGWTLSELNPFPKSNTSPEGLVIDEAAAVPLKITEAKESTAILAAKLTALTLATSYAVKYGELGIDLPFTANGAAGVAMVIGIPAITGVQYYLKSKEEGGELAFGFGGGGSGDGESALSMADVKKYGLAGTVAYVLTELAFWAVAFPVASTLFYNSVGHWPDVINDAGDRTAVLASVFAGANVARLLVPLRFGAALALAPWVDENLINRQKA